MIFSDTPYEIRNIDGYPVIANPLANGQILVRHSDSFVDMLSGMLKKIAVPSLPKITYAWVFVFMWAMLIFWLSHQPKTNFAPAQPSTLMPSYSDLLFAAIGLDGDTVVSKTAHVMLFGMLAWLVWQATRQWQVALLFTLSYAMFDEWHQSYIPGRTGRLTDVLIDGVAALVLLGVLHCRRGLFALSKFESDENRTSRKSS